MVITGLPGPGIGAAGGPRGNFPGRNRRPAPGCPRPATSGPSFTVDRRRRTQAVDAARVAARRTDLRCQSCVGNARTGLAFADVMALCFGLRPAPGHSAGRACWPASSPAQDSATSPGRHPCSRHTCGSDVQTGSRLHRLDRGGRYTDLSTRIDAHGPSRNHRAHRSISRRVYGRHMASPRGVACRGRPLPSDGTSDAVRASPAFGRSIMESRTARMT